MNREGAVTQIPQGNTFLEAQPPELCLCERNTAAQRTGLQKASDKQRAADANDTQVSTFKSHLPAPRPYFTNPWLLPLLLGVWGGGCREDIPARYCHTHVWVEIL